MCKRYYKKEILKFGIHISLLKPFFPNHSYNYCYGLVFLAVHWKLINTDQIRMYKIMMFFVVSEQSLLQNLFNSLGLGTKPLALKTFVRRWSIYYSISLKVSSLRITNLSYKQTGTLGNRMFGNQYCSDHRAA